MVDKNWCVVIYYPSGSCKRETWYSNNHIELAKDVELAHPNADFIDYTEGD